jgi:hypothetical protein
MEPELVFEEGEQSGARFWASEGGTLGVSVRESQIIGTEETEQGSLDHEQTFENTFHLTREQARELRALIDEHFPSGA